MKKLKIYLDTSVISAYFDAGKPLRHRISPKWFKNDLSAFEPFVSTLTLQEIENTPDKKLVRKMIRLIDSHAITALAMQEEIVGLAALYRKIIIPKEINDSLHIAIASHYGMDAIVSWNFKHIVNLKTINAIHAINQKYGYKFLEIVTVESLGGDKYADI
jgi:predicted nucleic acid-binding protein